MSNNHNDFREKMQQARHVVTHLPTIDEPLQQHSEQLQEKIRNEMEQQGGVISFERYMQMALYEPGLGYYTSTLTKLGEQGDFITAPEISPLFGRCLANFCQQALAELDDGKILEFGAGSGRMAADILQELDARDALPAAYCILELSADLQHRQQQTLQATVPHLLNRVQWLSSLPEPGFIGIVLGNELLDAMPVHRFRIEDDGIKTLGVGWSENARQFILQSMPASPAIIQSVQHIMQTTGTGLPVGYESECSLAHQAWLKSVADIMEQGLMLLIDYGYGRPEYYQPQRNQGTLMCHFRHRAHDDPFQFIGCQDITAYVDFTTIAEAALECDMQLQGYSTQCGFLLENGLESMMPDPERVSQQAFMAFAQQVKTLTLPSEMGERFKVMALSKNMSAELPGFRLQDQRGRL